MKNDKNLNPIGQFKAQLNTPKTETKIILNDWQSETKKSKLSPAARSKVVNHNKPYQSLNQENYGPCYSCGNPDLKFELEIILENTLGGKKEDTVYSTSAAETAITEIKNGSGSWKGGWTVGSFLKKNREELANKVRGFIDRHKNGEAINDTAHVRNI